MFVNVNGARLFFDVAGPGVRIIDGAVVQVPILLILHGGPGFDHMGAKAELLPLTEHFQLVWIDHRGNGRSSGDDPAEWKLAQWADDVREFCDVLGISRPIVLGQSFGGHVAQAYATRYPDHPSKVIFSSICAKWDFDLMVRRFRERGGEAVGEAAANMWGRMDDEDIAVYMKICHPLYVAHPERTISRGPLIVKNQVLRHYLRPGAEFQSIDLRPDLAKVRCPTLVLAGTEDPIIPWELSRQMADALINAPLTYRQMDDCGHGVWRDNPGAACEAIRAFIAE